jgi:cysteine synthase
MSNKMLAVGPYEGALFRGVGNTPRVELSIAVSDIVHRLVLKVESANPTGSIKDRVAWGLLSDALRLRDGKPPDALAGINESPELSVSIAFAGNSHSIPTKIFIKSDFFALINKRVEKYHADCIALEGSVISKSIDQNSAGSLCFLDDCSRFVCLHEKNNQRIAEIHAEWIAPELFSGPDRRWDIIFLTDSSDDLPNGLIQFRAESVLDTKIAFVESKGSLAFSDNTSHAMLPSLFGSTSKFMKIDRSALDAVFRIADADAVAVARYANDTLKLDIGLASAGVVLGALQYLVQQEDSQTVLCICPDGIASLDSFVTLGRPWEEVEQESINSRQRLQPILQRARRA